MIKSYCKINLSLRILNKLKSGFHNIQSNSFLLELHDIIKIKKIQKKKDIIIINGPFKNFINKHKNSITETLAVLRQKKMLEKNLKYEVNIYKNIPVFSGLGGSASNAAYILKHLLKKKITTQTFKIFTKKIGSDLNLFIYNQTFQKNFKNIIRYKKKFHFYFIIVYPYIKCSTKKVYSQVRGFSPKVKQNYANISSKKRFINLIKNERNDLQKISTSKFTKIKKIIDFVSKQKGCYFSRMTGSGSACFGMFRNKKSASLGMKSLKKKFPRYWCVVTKTI